MGLRKQIYITLVFLFLFYSKTYADWTGPQDVIVETWGSGSNQVGIDYGDSGDRFPQYIAIRNDGAIVIYDEVNDRVKIYSSGGGTLGVLIPQGSYEGIELRQWGLKPRFLGERLLFRFKDKYRIYALDGILINEFAGIGYVDELVVVGETIYAKDHSTKSYSLYPPTGALIRTTTERPLELGKVKEKKTATGYTYTVQYPDITNPNTVKTYTVSVPRPVKEFKRDTSGNLYGIHQYPVKKVIRFDDAGNIIAEVQMPDTQREPRWFDGVEWRSSLIVSYGEPVIAPNGDVYTWKRTPDRYSIIKWTWK